MKNYKMNKAVSLKYNGDEATPKVSFKGDGELADRILKIAEESDIPIIEDSDLAEILSKFNIGDFIDEDLYEVIAEVFAFLYRMNGKL